jgi:aspartate/methionine/tyrosine aminotransferase
MEVLEKARAMEAEGVDVVHLEVGEPDFDVPCPVKDEICRASEGGYTHYTHSCGEPELREEICRHYQSRYGVSIEPSRVVVTSGTSPAMMLLFSAILEQGDEVILSDPRYSCYPNFINFLGGKTVDVPVSEESGFQLNPVDVASNITEATRAVLINSPSNPTGNLISKENMKRIADVSPFVISDEIYHGLVYEGEEHSILEFTEDAAVLNGFSKLYAMTGLRLGYLIAPRSMIRPIQKMQQNFFICANSLSQKAGIAALRSCNAEVERMRQIYNERRKFMIARLKAMGLGITVNPTGAFYVFANARHISSNSYDLAFEILEKAHVGVTPGIDFGRNGEGYLRLSYANSMDRIAEGLDRIERFLEDRKMEAM